MDPLLGILHPPRHPGAPVVFPIRTDNRDQRFRPRACNGLASFFCFLVFEQNQRSVYREVLIVGDLSKEDINRAETSTSPAEPRMTPQRHRLLRPT